MSQIWPPYVMKLSSIQEMESTMLRILCAVFWLIFVGVGSPALAQDTQAQSSLVAAIFAQEESRLQIMEVDRAFNELAQKQGVAAAFGAYALEDAVWLPNGAEPVHGRDAIVEALSGGQAGSTMIWEPEDALMSGSQDLGVTWGRYVFHGKDDDGNPVESHGKYTTVWKKNAVGDWKFALDVGNQNPAPE